MTVISEFRSDTFTLPDDAMRKVIYEAEVGNSAYGEDPSVRALEEATADYFDREAALFFPSATMAGQAAIAVWCQPAEQVIIEEYGHNYHFEAGSMAMISATQARPLVGRHGILEPEQLAAAVIPTEKSFIRTALIVLENTSNFGGGTVYPRKTLTENYKVAVDHNLPVHIDGARIFNALQYYRQTDPGILPSSLLPAHGSMSICFSKGLGAPMGAALIGSAEFIAEAERVRSLLGGMLRQAGFMAAAALYGMQHNVERLLVDHDNAQFLARELAELSGLSTDLDSVQTNMVYVDVDAGVNHAIELVATLQKQGVQVWNLGPRLRFVTSMLVERRDCERAVKAMSEALTV
ncbi:MAG: threonine aldolase [Halieaceae bacterium]|jgi:threonine aldolase